MPGLPGKRFTDEVLEVKYNGYSISDVLDGTVRENASVFVEPEIAGKLELLCEVGLDYLQLGQPTSTLSGGEAQRIKLAKELGKKTGDIPSICWMSRRRGSIPGTYASFAPC
ncbi:hypothetical protein VQ056_27235 [Paenibacillus sp. JTLBN-2024]